MVLFVVSRLDLLINRIDEVQEQQQLTLTSTPAPGVAPQAAPQTPLSPSSVIVKMPPMLEGRLSNLEKQVGLYHFIKKWLSSLDSAAIP